MLVNWSRVGKNIYWLLMVKVTSASVQDKDGAKILFTENLKYFHKLELTRSDSAYAGQLIKWSEDNR